MSILLWHFKLSVSNQTSLYCYVFPHNTAEIRHCITEDNEGCLDSNTCVLSGSALKSQTTDLHHHTFSLTESTNMEQFNMEVWHSILLHANMLSYNAWRGCSSKKEYSFIVYSPSGDLKPAWLSFFCETQKDLFIAEYPRWKKNIHDFQGPQNYHMNSDDLVQILYGHFYNAIIKFFLLSFYECDSSWSPSAFTVWKRVWLFLIFFKVLAFGWNVHLTI